MNCALWAYHELLGIFFPHLFKEGGEGFRFWWFLPPFPAGKVDSSVLCKLDSPRVCLKREREEERSATEILTRSRSVD